MSDARAGNDISIEQLLGQVADEFSERLSRGEKPSIEEYATRYPEIAAIINQVFPALQEMPSQFGDNSSLPDDFPGETEIPGRLGDYRIVREIARGGMGVVYEAEQLSLDRRVALKVLPFAAVLDQKQLQRFKNESAAAAQLHHTNIVPVFSVGCERGVYYYAMQHIDGQPLSAVVRELQNLAGVKQQERPDSITDASSIAGSLTRGQWHPASADHPKQVFSKPTGTPQPTSGFSSNDASEDITKAPVFFQSIARIGVQAADALHHAHERGIIHRDIKPANLLLDKEGHLWVTDFGLAFMQNDASLTVPGDLLGTLRYMSPEQALAKKVAVDQRTDIYSLGITLYELLTLKPVFSGKDRQELLWQIATEEPVLLRQVNPDAPRELETIIHKAISKDPESRYSTAQELADDLNRFLSNRPILAQPPTIADKVSKWARRHRSAVGVAAGLLVISLVTLSISTVLILRERAEAIHQRDRALAQRLIAEQQRNRAEANLRFARDSVDRMLTRVSASELGDEQHTEKIRRAFLEDSLEFHRHLLQEKSSDTETRQDTGHAYMRVADINALLCRDAEAISAYEQAITVFANLTKDFPEEPNYASQLAGCYASLATLFWERNRFDEAKPSANTAIDVLKKLCAEKTDENSYKIELARALNLRGLVLKDTGDFKGAADSFRESIQVRKNLTKILPEASEHRLELSRALRNLATLLVKENKLDDANATVEEVLKLQEQLVDQFPEKLNYGAELAHTHRWWDETRLTLHGPDIPDEEVETASPPDQDEALAELPQVPWYSERLADSYQKLDSALLKAGQPQQAAEAHQQAVDLQENLAAKYPHLPEYRMDLAQVHIVRARTLAGASQYADSVRAYQAGIEELILLTESYPEVVEYRNQLDKAQREKDETLSKVDFTELIALGKKSPDGVEQAVELAQACDAIAVPTHTFTRLTQAEYLILGGEYERAAQSISKALQEGATAHSYFKTLGIALLGCHRQLDAFLAFENGFRDTAVWNSQSPEYGCPDHWVTAYFLDMTTADDFTRYWLDITLSGIAYAPYPWFYIGLRMEIENRIPDAISAYTNCVSFSNLSNAHHSVNWAQYRLNDLMPEQEEYTVDPVDDSDVQPEQDLDLPELFPENSKQPAEKPSGEIEEF